MRVGRWYVQLAAIWHWYLLLYIGITFVLICFSFFCPFPFCIFNLVLIN